jgi:hypothetical protein
MSTHISQYFYATVRKSEMVIIIARKQQVQSFTVVIDFNTKGIAHKTIHVNINFTYDIAFNYCLNKLRCSLFDDDAITVQM